MSITIFLVIFLIPSSYSLSFNFPSIGHSDSRSITITGGGYISEKGIQITTDERSEGLVQLVGRAMYNDPLHLWDQASGKMADFWTHFSFVMDSEGSLNFGDGLTFFLAPIGSTLQSWSFGGSMGIGNRDNAPVNSTSSQQAFVAVEFDTFKNSYDPPHETHVGIDINSMESVVTEVVTVGFSAATGDLFETHTIKSWKFYSSALEPQPPPLGFSSDSSSSTGGETSIKSLELYSSPFDFVYQSFSPAPSPSPSPSPGTDADTGTGGGGGGGGGGGLVIGLSVGLSIFILSSVIGGCFLRWKKKKKKNNNSNMNKESADDQASSSHPHMDIEFQRGCGPKKFSYRELVLATKNFAEEEKLGEGGFGGVYRGLLAETNSYIAVKRVSSGSKQGLKEYASEVKIISQLRHRNLVQLHGWCHEGEELLLVYEFLPNGSLDSHLFKGQTILPWQVRYRIAQGISSALFYLHEDWEQAVVHRDIKSSNILLDSKFNAKLGDFGLARLMDHEKGSQTTILAGTFGYMAPECVVTGRASKESDVYSLGIVFLELACGKRPIGRSRDQGTQLVLVEWVWSLYRTGKLLEAADPKLEMGYNKREMEQLIVVGMWCARPECDQRPSIRQVINVLNFEVEMPAFALMMPVPTYANPRMSARSSSSAFSGSGTTDSVSCDHYSGSLNVNPSAATAPSSHSHLEVSSFLCSLSFQASTLSIKS